MSGYSLNYFDTTSSLWFNSKDEATELSADIANNDDFKFFKYTARLLKQTESDEADEILRSTSIAVPLKYLLFCFVCGWY